MAASLMQGQDMGNSIQSGMYAGGAALGNALYYGADKLGIDDIARVGADLASSMGQKSADAYDQVADKNHFNRFLRGTASRIPMMAPGLLASVLSSGGAIPWALASLVSGSMESMANSGGVQRDLIDAGVDPQRARRSANMNFITELPLDMATARFGIAGKGLNANVRETAGDALGNLFQEPGQTFLGRAARKSGGSWEGMGRELMKQISDWNRVKTAFTRQGAPSALSSIALGALLGPGATTGNMLASGGGDFEEEAVPVPYGGMAVAEVPNNWPADRFAPGRKW